MNPANTAQATDLTYKAVAATGYLLDCFGEMERLKLKSPIFTMALKQTANRFKGQLERAESVVTGHIDSSRVEVADQLGSSYVLFDTLLSVHIEAGKLLSEEGIRLLSAEFEGVAAKYGIKLNG